MEALRAVEPVKPGEVQDPPSAETIQREALPHLLAVLKGAVKLMDEIGSDVDARVIEAHAAELAAGREWPGSGDLITSPPAIHELPTTGEGE